MSLFDAVRQEYYFQIFPQSIIALFCICFYGPSVWFPVEVVLEHNPQQSNLKDGDKFHYKNIFSRIRQLSSFYNIISLLKPDLSSAQYLDIVFYWDIKAKQDLIDNFSLEFPHIVQFFNSSFISRLHLFVHYPRRFIFLYSQLLYNKLHNIRN